MDRGGQRIAFPEQRGLHGFLFEPRNLLKHRRIDQKIGFSSDRFFSRVKRWQQSIPSTQNLLGSIFIILCVLDISSTDTSLPYYSRCGVILTFANRSDLQTGCMNARNTCISSLMDDFDTINHLSSMTKLKIGQPRGLNLSDFLPFQASAFLD